ncbi:dihydrolipoyllysine-residue succinyltransferase component of 2-oxoglutarate dehydrogenase complex 2 [Scenedesmus sp. PABB004]|nr:dihydrolipoyllysine-residue succinyltransferase component of 2-oxoglutarate dehydrogenase complex 2 [Scenedesmus sp. PABB004]
MALRAGPRLVGSGLRAALGAASAASGVSTGGARLGGAVGAPALARCLGSRAAPPRCGAAAAAALEALRGARAAPAGPAGAGGVLLRRLLHASGAAGGDVVVPAMGDSITEGSIAAVLKQPGDVVAEDDVIAQIETDKVTIDVKFGGKSGRLTEVLVAEGDTVVVGQAVARVEEGDFGGAAPAAAAPAPDAPADAPPPPKAAAPAAAEQQQRPAAPAAPATPKASEAPPPAGGAAPAAGGDRPERRVKMTRLRLRVAERLKGAQNTYAMLTTFNEVDMTGLMELRAAYKDAFFERHGVKLGFMSAFVKASAAALADVPAVNAVIDGSDIIYRDYTDISIAVATPKGLVVPVLRGVDRMGFADVEKAINALGRKARDGTISIDDMAGGTFTISNGGVYGSMLSTPIINPPQSAILGMHNITQRAMVVGGGVAARPMMYIALTYDHRLIDGREAVTFLKRIKEVVEDPRRLLLDVRAERPDALVVAIRGGAVAAGQPPGPLAMGAAYFDPVALLAEDALVPCEFPFGVKSLGRVLDPTSSAADLRKETRAELPLWLAQALLDRGMVSIQAPAVYGEWMQRRVDAGAACISLKQHPAFYHVGSQCAELTHDAGLAGFLRKTFSQRSQELLAGSLRAPDGAALQRVLGKLNEEEKALYEAGRQGAALQEQWWAAGGHTARLLRATAGRGGVCGVKRRRTPAEAAADKENAVA